MTILRADIVSSLKFLWKGKGDLQFWQNLSPISIYYNPSPAVLRKCQLKFMEKWLNFALGNSKAELLKQATFSNSLTENYLNIYFINILKINSPNQYFLTLFGPQVEKFQFWTLKIRQSVVPFCLFVFLHCFNFYLWTNSKWGLKPY